MSRSNSKLSSLLHGANDNPRCKILSSMSVKVYADIFTTNDGTSLQSCSSTAAWFHVLLLRRVPPRLVCLMCLLASLAAGVPALKRRCHLNFLNLMISESLSSVGYS
ncbi:hypothetical protein FKM82_010557 [Ascaphus truei]